MSKLPLIAPKPFADFTAEEYHSFVQSFYGLRVRATHRKASPALGIAITRTAKGALSIRRSKARSFDYVTWSELEALANAVKCSKADLWQAFKTRKFIITKTRMEAERLYEGGKNGSKESS